jgi:iron only hydrogenase large subunit-like protein
VTETLIQIDQELCTGCGNCTKTCPSEAITGERNKPHSISEQRCVTCGRCVQVCCAYDSVFQKYDTSRSARVQARELPSGFKEPLFAAHDRCFLSNVQAALADPSRIVLVQCGPTACDTVAEDFGMAPGGIRQGQVVSALKKIGFSRIYDYRFSAAIAALEQAFELVDRLQSGNILPVINSSCPACVKFVEQFHPELIHYLAGSKSPHQIAGALLKSYVAQKLKIDPGKIYSVSIGSCTSRKFEANRPEMNKDIDAVLTVRELAYLIKDRGINISALQDEAFDQELPGIDGMENVYCTPGDIAAAVFYIGAGLLGKDSNIPEVQFADTATEGVQTAAFQMDGFNLKAAAVCGLQNAIPFFEAMKTGKNDIAFMELLACPMGCVSGGGQPKVLLPLDRTSSYAARAGLNSKLDAKKLIGIAKRPEIQKVYQEFFGKSCGDRSNRAVQTQYSERRLSD